MMWTERNSDSPEIGFCIATGEAAHAECRASSGLWMACENSVALEKA
jgi:hypothetical protein